MTSRGAEPDFEGATGPLVRKWNSENNARQGPGFRFISEHNALVDAYLALSAEAKGWRCFHCDSVLTDEAKAAEHFGKLGDRASCQDAIRQARAAQAEAALAGKLREALAGMVGLIDLLLVLDDLSDDLRAAITNSHRLIDGRKVLE